MFAKPRVASTACRATRRGPRTAATAVRVISYGSAARSRSAWATSWAELGSGSGSQSSVLLACVASRSLSRSTLIRSVAETPSTMQ